MMRSLVLVALLACGLEDRVEEATEMAIEDCRTIVQEEITGLVGQVALAAAVVCGQVGDEARDAILLYLGCVEDPAVGWNCSGARARACEP
jgi:hypothetical protein